MQYIQHKHTNTFTVNQSVIRPSVQCAVFGVRGCCHLKLLPWPGLNLGIRELTNVAYSLVEDAVLLIHHLGQSALLAKVDLKGVYQVVPVHLRDWPYLGSVDAGCFRCLPTPKSLSGWPQYRPSFQHSQKLWSGSCAVVGCITLCTIWMTG